MTLSSKYSASMVSMLRIKLLPAFRRSSLSTLDTGSGWEIPAICHGAGVWLGVTDSLYPRILELGNGRFQAAVSFLVWVASRGVGWTCRVEDFLLKREAREPLDARTHIHRCSFPSHGQNPQNLDYQ